MKENKEGGRGRGKGRGRRKRERGRGKGREEKRKERREEKRKKRREEKTSASQLLTVTYDTHSYLQTGQHYILNPTVLPLHSKGTFLLASS
jgi:hypothetical protein